MKIRSIAPCGMNCDLCLGSIREKNRCPGCRDLDKLANNKWKYCSERCGKYPCRRLKQLDKRYSTKYGMSMIENLDMIDEKGVREFIANEKKRWIKDGRIFCVHRKEYFEIKP